MKPKPLVLVGEILEELPPRTMKPAKVRKPNRWELLRSELPERGWMALEPVGNSASARKTALQWGVELVKRNGVDYARRTSTSVPVDPPATSTSPAPAFPKVGRIGHLPTSNRARLAAAEAI